jgi:hypothetical protein
VLGFVALSLVCGAAVAQLASAASINKLLQVAKRTN